MDPSLYHPNMPYAPPAGLPQESKLVTYMNRSTSTPTRPLSQAMGGLSLEDSPSSASNVREFIPMNYYAQAQMMPESPGGSPPSVLAMGMPSGSHMGGGPPGSLMGGLPQNSHMGSHTQNSHMGSHPQTSHMGSHPQTSHMGSHPQNSHMGAGISQAQHINSNVQQPQHMQAQPQMLHENVGGTTYFFPSDSINASALNSSASLNASAEACMGPQIIVPSPYATQMFIPMPTHMHPMPSKPGLAASFYQPETIRTEVYQRNDAVFLSQQDMRQFPELPENLDIYTEPIPLEGVAPHSMSSSYRVTNRHTGEHFALRRLHSYGTCPSQRLEMWKQIDHPNVVILHDHLTSNAFGDHSMLLVYSYFPSCVTLMNKYLVGCGNPVSDGTAPFMDPFSSDPDAPRPYTHQKNAMLRAVASGALLPEAVLWSIIVQLTAALRAIHNAGLACRTLDPSKVIMNGCRVRIAWCGAADALHPTTGDITQAQQEDLTALGRLALSLACRTLHCDNVSNSVEIVTRSYSPDLKNVIIYLLSGTPARRSVTDLMPMIGARFYTQIELRYLLVGDWPPLPPQAVPRLYFPRGGPRWAAMARPGARRQLPQPTRWWLPGPRATNDSRRAEHLSGVIRGAQALPRSIFRRGHAGIRGPVEPPRRRPDNSRDQREEPLEESHYMVRVEKWFAANEAINGKTYYL